MVIAQSFQQNVKGHYRLTGWI